MIVLGIPTIRCFDLLDRCIESALAGTVPPDAVMVVDNSAGACPQRNDDRIAYAVPNHNMGVAKSWNLMARMAPEGDLIIANDDMLFAPDTIAKLLEAAHPRAGIASALEGERFACFWLNREAWEELGGFDEGFWPAYFEDNDYARRLTLAGWELVVAPSAVVHAGSATLRSYTRIERAEHDARFERNKARYIAKWGGLPGQEPLTEPRHAA